MEAIELYIKRHDAGKPGQVMPDLAYLKEHGVEKFHECIRQFMFSFQNFPREGPNFRAGQGKRKELWIERVC